MKRILVLLLILLVGWLFVRFVIGGPEDDWICVDGKWVEHGAPAAPKPTEPCGAALSHEKAFDIARESSDCSMAGVLTDKYVYNDSTKTWWIDLERMPELEKDGCNPACVVSEETETAEVNWRCTGAIPPEN